MWRRCPRVSPRSATRTHQWTNRPACSRRCSSWPRATRRRVSATRRGRRTFARWRGGGGGGARAKGAKKATAATKATATKKSPRVRMPLLVVANSPDKQAALAGLERWKQRHPEAAAHLAIDDVLVDSMRGRSSTWTRIRVNLRHVPEKSRPAQETPDPDDDPTRGWREAHPKRGQDLQDKNPVNPVQISTRFHAAELLQVARRYNRSASYHSANVESVLYA